MKTKKYRIPSTNNAGQKRKPLSMQDLLNPMNSLKANVYCINEALKGKPKTREMLWRKYLEISDRRRKTRLYTPTKEDKILWQSFWKGKINLSEFRIKIGKAKKEAK